jgi:hypothetical protein
MPLNSVTGGTRRARADDRHAPGSDRSAQQPSRLRSREGS